MTEKDIKYGIPYCPECKKQCLIVSCDFKNAFDIPTYFVKFICDNCGLISKSTDNVAELKANVEKVFLVMVKDEVNINWITFAGSEFEAIVKVAKDNLYTKEELIAEEHEPVK